MAKAVLVMSDETEIRAELRKRVEDFLALWDEYADDPADKPAEGTLLRRLVDAGCSVTTWAEAVLG